MHTIERATTKTSSITKATWTREDIDELYCLPFNDLLFRAHTTHVENFPDGDIQLSTLLSIKTGACPEDCAYCSQSARYKTGLNTEKLLPLEEIVASAKSAIESGATRFCMGAAWRSPRDKDVERVAEAVSAVKALGLETCATLGMLEASQAETLRDAGLDYYNHNLDTSEEFYGNIITTRDYQDRLDTLEHVRQAGMKVCCGGILGLGEGRSDRVGLILALANLNPPPESVPINNLVAVPGTPLENATPIDSMDFVTTIAVARITMPASRVRLSAGREAMSDEMQALCFFAGANSIFYGDELLTTGNASPQHDAELLQRLGLKIATNSPI
jgi:biotin synthase